MTLRTTAHYSGELRRCGAIRRLVWRILVEVSIDAAAFTLITMRHLLRAAPRYGLRMAYILLRFPKYARYLRMAVGRKVGLN